MDRPGTEWAESEELDRMILGGGAGSTIARDFCWRGKARCNHDEATGLSSAASREASRDPCAPLSCAGSRRHLR